MKFKTVLIVLIDLAWDCPAWTIVGSSRWENWAYTFNYWYYSHIHVTFRILGRGNQPQLWVGPH
jgi:hypothetical protein